jgi:hypothetical protein
LGWFIVYNGDNSTASPGAFLIAFLNHLFPTEPYVAPEPSADFSSRAERYTGVYRSAKIPRSTFYKLISLSVEFEVTNTPQGTLLFRGGEYVEAEANLFKPTGSSNPWNDSLLFLKDSSGQAYFSSAGGIYEKVPWYETSAFTWTLVVVCIASFVSMPVVLFIDAYVNRGRTKSKTAASKWVQGSRWLSVAFSIPFVLAVVGVRLAAGNLTVWNLVVTCGILGSALALVTLSFAALSWRQRCWSLPERLHFTLTTVAAMAFVWFLYNWNLLGFQTL